MSPSTSRTSSGDIMWGLIAVRTLAVYRQPPRGGMGRRRPQDTSPSWTFGHSRKAAAASSNGASARLKGAEALLRIRNQGIVRALFPNLQIGLVCLRCAWAAQAFPRTTQVIVNGRKITPAGLVIQKDCRRFTTPFHASVEFRIRFSECASLQVRATQAEMAEPCIGDLLRILKSSHGAARVLARHL